MAVAGFLVAGSGHLEAQREHTFALNVSALSSANVGVTWTPTGSFALRPSVSFSWDRREVSSYNPVTQQPITERTTTQFGLDIDALFTVAAAPPFAAYLGLGGSVGGYWLDSDADLQWGAAGIAGVRVHLIERLAVYGELRYSYSHMGGDRGYDRLRLSTAPIGVMFYLN
jgi:hypothetical protein